MARLLGWLFGLENVTSIDQIEPSFAAPWASDDFGPFWVLLATLAALSLGAYFYIRWQQRGPRAARVALGVVRGLLLGLLVVTLADPVLRLTVTNIQPPSVYVVFDGTDSMAIRDDYPADDRKALDSATGRAADKTGKTDKTANATAGGGKSDGDKSRADQAAASGGAGGGAASGAASANDATPATPSRIEYLQSLLRKDDQNLIDRLVKERKVQVQPFLFDGRSTSVLRKLSVHPSGRQQVDAKHIADQLTTEGQVTALGSVFDEARQQSGAGNVAAMILFSDFVNNAGPKPLGPGDAHPATRLGAPVFTVGVGAIEAVDLAVELGTEARMKRAERTSLSVKLKSSGLQGLTANVTVTAKRLSGEGESEAPEITVGQRTVQLNNSEEKETFTFTPQEAGRFEFTARAEPLAGESLDQNNVASREVNVIDDYLRLMYVAYEPTWEWRFVKEVFHRDKLVGMQGFRTFLSSSDARVRQSNVLFLPTLTPKRSDFFANDVIFLDDMPASSLSSRFCEMLDEYVHELGGGLVVIAGPRFGPRELAQTPIRKMLPVILDPNARPRDEREFAPQLTYHAQRYPFMKLGDTDAETAKAWQNLGQLSWYQPVANVTDQATVLAEHPTDTCADGKKKQPLIAVAPYGKGEVVYVGMNEMWRLRRKYGEKYYRQFWSQLIYRLGMSHALGDSKRFVPRLDRPQYQSEEKVTFTVEAFDENYEPLTEEKLPERTLVAELTVPDPAGGPSQVRELPVPLLRKGTFETRFPVYAAGQYTIRVKDPINGKFEERRFEVTSLSAERRQSVRNVQLQADLAARTGGQTYDLTNVSKLIDDLDLSPRRETVTRNHALWNTPLWFGLIVLLMLSEWLCRKFIHLS